MHTPHHPERSPEKIPQATIRLELFRHDDKAKAKEGQTDQEVQLTEKGRKHATEVGKGKNPQPKVGLAYGSRRIRSTETALRQLLANENIGENDSTEDIMNKIRGEIKMGRKNIESELLDFIMEGEYNKIALTHFTEIKDFIPFLYEESDALVRKFKDSKSTTYTRAAGDVATLIKKYIKILPRWDKLTKEKPEEYAKYGNELQRFMGSHQSIFECFLLKVAEKAEGPKGVERVMALFPSKNGFGFSEGLTVRLIPKENEIAVEVTCKDQKWELTPKQIDEIIDEKDKLNQETISKSI